MNVAPSLFTSTAITSATQAVPYSYAVTTADPDAGQARTITAPLPGAGQPNPYCASFTRHAVNPVSGQPVGATEDEQSVGTHVTASHCEGLPVLRHGHSTFVRVVAGSVLLVALGRVIADDRQHGVGRQQAADDERHQQ